MNKSISTVVLIAILLPGIAWCLPVSYRKAGAVDIDKFEQAGTVSTVENGEEYFSTDFSWDPEYNQACGMANAASLLWGSGYRYILDEDGHPIIAATQYEYFEWICRHYWDSLPDDAGAGHPGMGLAAQKRLMDEYLADASLNTNPEENPRKKVDIAANVENGQNVPLTADQVESLKTSLVACSLISLILQNEAGENHEVQLVGWNEDGTFIIYDPDTDGADWDPESATYTFRDEEYWGSSLENGWTLTTEDTGKPYSVVGYKKFSAIPEPGTLYLMITGLLGAACIGRRQSGRRQ